MRQEDKEVDGPDLERAEERKRANELVKGKGDELYDLDGKPESFDRDGERTSVVIGAVQTILKRERIVIDTLQLDRRELRALEALKTAVEGRDQQINGFVFAEDRQTLLEQALAVLQPDLASVQEEGGKPFADLMKGVAALRAELSKLFAAQVAKGSKPRRKAIATEGDKDDKPDDDADTSLTGPERTIDKPKSSLDGPERAIEKPPTSLTGPERKPEPKGPTTLGDPAEIAKAATPWWKRGGT